MPHLVLTFPPSLHLCLHEKNRKTLAHAPMIFLFFEIPNARAIGSPKTAPPKPRSTRTRIRQVKSNGRPGFPPSTHRHYDSKEGCCTCTPSLLFLLTSLCHNNTVRTCSSPPRPLKISKSFSLLDFAATTSDPDESTAGVGAPGLRRHGGRRPGRVQGAGSPCFGDFHRQHHAQGSSRYRYHHDLARRIGGFYASSLH